MKIWVTKYALTQGIFSYDLVSMDGDMVVVRSSEYWPNKEVYYHGNDWHDTLDAAIKRADVMRKNKITSLKKQIDKLDNMVFNVKEVE